MAEVVERYGAKWPQSMSELEVEFYCIRKGGTWRGKSGNECGAGLFAHYKRAQQIIWPDDYHHRWSDLELQEILNNTITVVTGPKDTGKTRVALVRYGLTDYYCFPNETLIIVSSTTMASLERRVWGDMKGMHNRAKELWPDLPGIVIDSKYAIVTDDLTDESVISRDMRRGILCVPCKNSSGSFTGIASYVGMKQKRRRHLGDEFQFMNPGMMDSIANMNSGDYKGVFTGNPIGQNDPLDQMSEPEGGWESFPEPDRTAVWKNKRFLNSRTICLYGPDSPTNDFPDGSKRYPGLINTDSIARVVAGYGKDSHQYCSQALGIRKVGLTARRVITKELCRQFDAFSPDVIWGTEKRIKICALDAAYGGSGGDRAVGGHVEFGRDIKGKQILYVHPPVIAPVSYRNEDSPEDQLSKWAKSYCEYHGIPPDNFFFDSTGRGSLGPSLARLWSAMIQPVEFGGTPTDRPVDMDTFVTDPKTGKKIRKTARLAYSYFVDELWWSSRRVIESGQIRNLPDVVCDEGCAREWEETAGNKIRLETKKIMRERCGYSPDYYDWFVTACEGARRRGFSISKLANDDDVGTSTRANPILELALQQRASARAKQLSYA